MIYKNDFLKEFHNESFITIFYEYSNESLCYHFYVEIKTVEYAPYKSAVIHLYDYAELKEFIKDNNIQYCDLCEICYFDKGKIILNEEYDCNAEKLEELFGEEEE